MQFNVHVDTSALDQKLNIASKFVSEETIPLAAVIAHATLKATTAGGQDKYGKPLKPYTPKYKKYKERKVGSAEPVNMRLNNQMMNNPTLQGDTLTFTGKDALKAEGNLKHRPDFWGASKLVANEVSKGLQKALERALA